MNPILAVHCDGKYTVTCKECDQSFVHKEYLTRHIRCAHSDKKYNSSLPCEYCGISVKNMRRHIFRVHTNSEKNIKTPCIHCGKKIGRRNMNRHLKIHQVQSNLILTESQVVTLEDGEAVEKYECIKCNCQFANKLIYQRHLSRHHSKKEYSDCEKCGKNISVLFMDRHIKENCLENSTFNCKNCEMVFGSKRRLKEHYKHFCKILKVTKITDEKTENSKNNSNDRRMLTDHRKCEKCDKTYSSIHSLRQHIERVHDKVINFTCTDEGCKLGFYNNSDYCRHIKLYKHMEYANGETEEGPGILQFTDISQAESEAEAEPSLFSDPSHCVVQPMLPQHSSFITPDPIPRFHCEKCPKSFLSEEQLSLHVMHHDAMPLLHAKAKRVKTTVEKSPVDPNIIKRPRGRPPKPKLQKFPKPRGRPPKDPKKKANWMRQWQEKVRATPKTLAQLLSRELLKKSSVVNRKAKLAHIRVEKVESSFVSGEQLHVIQYEEVVKQKTLKSKKLANIKRPVGRPPKPKVTKIEKHRGPQPTHPEQREERLRQRQERIRAGKPTHELRTAKSALLHLDEVTPLLHLDEPVKIENNEIDEITVYRKILPKI